MFMFHVYVESVLITTVEAESDDRAERLAKSRLSTTGWRNKKLTLCKEVA